MGLNDKDNQVLDAEILEEITTPDYSAAEEYKGPQKKPRGTRKKDHPKFTPEARETILQLVSVGTPDNHAANYAGVRVDTLYRWLEYGRVAQDKIDAGDEDDLNPVDLDFANFFSQYLKVKPSPIIGLLQTVLRAARGTKGDIEKGIPATKPNPQLALRLLEKLDPVQFGPRQNIDMNVSGKVAHGHLHGTVNQNVLDGGEIAKQLSTDELRALRADIISKKEPKKLPAKITKEAEKVDETTEELD